MAETGMWRGLLAGYQDVEAKRMAREQKEEELLERRKALALNFAMQYGTAPGSSSGGGAPGAPGGSSIEHQAQILKTRFGVSDDVIERVAGAGSSALTSVVDTLESQRLRFENDGLEFPADQVASIMDTLVLTPSSQDTFDFSQLESYIGQELDPIEREMIQRQQQRPSQLYTPEPAYMSPVEIKDINELEERAMNSVRQSATVEMGSLNSALNTINTAEENTSDPNRVARLEKAKQWILSRQTQVNEALSSAQGDQGNPFGLVNLYGNEFFQQMFEANPRLQNALLSPVFQTATTPQPKKVDSVETLGILRQLNIVQEGDLWQVYNPQTGSFEDVMIGE